MNWVPTTKLEEEKSKGNKIKNKKSWRTTILICTTDENEHVCSTGSENFFFLISQDYIQNSGVLSKNRNIP